jgi:hypothetical protein
MGPNSASIIRVSTRESGGTVADYTLDAAQDALIVVEVEAGAAVFTAGAKWQLGLEVKDLADGTAIAYTLTPTTADKGHMKDPGDVWDQQAKSFSYTVPAANLTAHKGHLGRVHAYLLIGNGPDYDATFTESHPFLIQP